MPRRRFEGPYEQELGRHHPCCYIDHQGGHHGCPILSKSSQAKPQTPCCHGRRHQRQGNHLSERQGLTAQNAGVDSPKEDSKATEKSAIHSTRETVYPLAYRDLWDSQTKSDRASGHLSIHSLSLAPSDRWYKPQPNSSQQNTLGNRSSDLGNHEIKHWLGTCSDCQSTGIA